MKVVFLGTSSAVPTLKRGLSAVAIMRKNEILLFDCGEATQIQLLKGKLKSSRIAKIFISHMHGDHVTGLMGLMMSFEMNHRQAPLSIFGPPGLGEYITTCTRLFHTHFSFDLHIQEITGGIILDEEEYCIRSGLLEHRILTLGYSLEEKDRVGEFLPQEAIRLGLKPGPLFGQLQKGKTVTLPDGRLIKPEMAAGPPQKGKKISYCVDTRPCPAARELCANSDMLIYDGTFDPSRADKAVAQGHSTTVEAALLAKESHVKRLVLTHISPRYSSTEKYQGQAKKIFKDITIAQDLMSLEV